MNFESVEKALVELKSDVDHYMLTSESIRDTCRRERDEAVERAEVMEQKWRELKNKVLKLGDLVKKLGLGLEDMEGLLMEEEEYDGLISE